MDEDDGKVVFPPGAFGSMFNAAVMALILQCGITIAATIIFVFTPPVGLECRSLGYITYGGLSIVIMFLNIISTIFARIADTREQRSTIVRGPTAFIAITLRRISFLLALINGIGLIVLSCFQFAGLLDNCYCYASVLGAKDFLVFSSNNQVTMIRDSRIVATLLSGAVMAIYMIFLRLMTLLPDDLDR